MLIPHSWNFHLWKFPSGCREQDAPGYASSTNRLGNQRLETTSRIINAGVAGRCSLRQWLRGRPRLASPWQAARVWVLLSFLRGSPGTFHSLAPVSCSALIAYDSYGIFFLMPNTLGTLLIHTRRKANWLEVSSESCTEDGIHWGLEHRTWDFPGGPLAETSTFNARGVSSTPGRSKIRWFVAKKQKQC